MLACGMWGELRVILQLRIEIVHLDIQKPCGIFDMEIRLIFLVFINLLHNQVEI